MISKDEINADFGSEKRAKIFKICVLILFIIFTGRLFQLQIIEGNIYKSLTDTQAIKQVIIEPFRGNIFDRNNKLIVHNEPSFSLTITPNDFQLESIPILLSILPLDTMELIKIYSAKMSDELFRQTVLEDFAKFTGYDTAFIMKNISQQKKYSRFVPVKIYRDLNFKELSLLEEYSDYLRGIDILVESKRLYEFNGNMAHILGYSREISKEELDIMSYFRRGDIIGKKGIEKSYDDFLRGQQGIQFIAVTSAGARVHQFGKDKNDVEALNGFDLKLSIDTKLQELAESLLEGKRGSVIAIDPQNGEVLVLAVKPDFDPRKFTGKISREFYQSIINDPEKPMLNRAIQSRYSPGSTWKMLIALAALNEGLINASTTINCPGVFHYGGRDFKCHGAHGSVNVQRAIQVSCNVFFYQLGLRLGMEKFEKYGKMFGFGQLTGIDLPDENRGIFPTMEWLKARNLTFTKGKLVNYGIGQGEISVTPLQMAVYTATIANKGRYIQPHIVRAIYNNLTNTQENIAYQTRYLDIDPKHFDVIHKGMYDVVNTPGGTANNARVSGISVCGKTGTAQNPHGRDHAWFVCFAPMDDPKIAICVMVENSGFGSVAAAPIAREILNEFFYPDRPRRKDSIFVQQEIPDSLQDRSSFILENGNE